MGDQGNIGKIGETVSLFYALLFVPSSVSMFRSHVSDHLCLIKFRIKNS